MLLALASAAAGAAVALLLAGAAPPRNFSRGWRWPLGRQAESTPKPEQQEKPEHEEQEQGPPQGEAAPLQQRQQQVGWRQQEQQQMKHGGAEGALSLAGEEGCAARPPLLLQATRCGAAGVQRSASGQLPPTPSAEHAVSSHARAGSAAGAADAGAASGTSEDGGSANLGPLGAAVVSGEPSGHASEQPPSVEVSAFNLTSSKEESLAESLFQAFAQGGRAGASKSDEAAALGGGGAHALARGMSRRHSTGAPLPALGRGGGSAAGQPSGATDLGGNATGSGCSSGSSASNWAATDLSKLPAGVRGADARLMHAVGALPVPRMRRRGVASAGTCTAQAAPSLPPRPPLLQASTWLTSWSWSWQGWWGRARSARSGSPGGARRP